MGNRHTSANNRLRWISTDRCAQDPNILDITRKIFWAKLLFLKTFIIREPATIEVNNIDETIIFVINAITIVASVILNVEPRVRLTNGSTKELRIPDCSRIPVTHMAKRTIRNELIKL